MKVFAAACVLSLACMAVMAQQPDGLTLPPGFQATVVAEHLGAIRHLAFRDANHLYVSTSQEGRGAPDGGILALHLDAHHHVDQSRHFSDIDNGTAIAVHNGFLYAASRNTLYRIPLSGAALDDGLVPAAKPEAVVVDIPGRPALAFDNSGNLYLAVPASGQVCVPKATPRGAQAKGLRPCPDLATRAGVWRFRANRTDQTFASGEHFATGFRDTNALAWSPADQSLYVAVYGRDGAHETWPKRISATEAEHIADAMYKVTQGTNMGWPYTYWNSARQERLLEPEYGGNGEKVVTDHKYAVPVAAFHAHVAPMDLTFYTASQFPAHYRDGAFIPMHGADDCDAPGFDGGFDVMFVPMNKSGQAGRPEVFAQGFAGPTHADLCSKRAAYRPVAVAVGPGGALYVADSQKGRIWRVSYRGQQ